MIKQVKLIRNDIGILAQMVSGVTHEVNKSHDSLLLANGWLGVMLGSLYGNYNRDRTAKDYVAPTADDLVLSTDVGRYAGLFEMDATDEKAGLLMSEIRRVNMNLSNIELCSDLAVELTIKEPVEIYIVMYKHNAMQHLYESQFWLDMYLKGIKK